MSKRKISKRKKNLGLKVAVKYDSKDLNVSMSFEYKTKPNKSLLSKRKPTFSFNWNVLLEKLVEKALWHLILECFNLIIDMLHNIFYTKYPLGKVHFIRRIFFA